MFSGLDLKRFLLSPGAAVFFGLAGVLSVWAIVLRYWATDLHQLTDAQGELLAWGGATAAVGVLSLLVGMWLFWANCDRSSRTTRRVWFFALLIGFTFGALPYYVFVYIPAVRRQLLALKGRLPS